MSTALLLFLLSPNTVRVVVAPSAPFHPSSHFCVLITCHTSPTSFVLGTAILYLPFRLLRSHTTSHHSLSIPSLRSSHLPSWPTLAPRANVLPLLTCLTDSSPRPIRHPLFSPTHSYHDYLKSPIPLQILPSPYPSPPPNPAITPPPIRAPKPRTRLARPSAQVPTPVLPRCHPMRNVHERARALWLRPMRRG